jgi:hypothetical protein
VDLGVDRTMDEIEMTIASQIPVVGELMDLHTVMNPEAPTYARIASTISLGINALMFGLAPNASGFLPSGSCFTAGTVVATSTGEVPIESLRVGDRVTTALMSTESRTAVDPQTWRLVRLEMPNPDNSDDVIDLSLLRPIEWIQATGAHEGSWIDLSLNELGIANRAHVRSIDPCPIIAHGAGRVVLGTLTHLSGYVRTLTFEGTKVTIEPTREHRLYSLDRNDWISAGDLVEGETLQSAGGPIVVASNTASPGVRRVFNIEVEAEHEFLASELEVRSHNSYAESCASGVAENILNIGSGDSPIKDAINLDIRRGKGVDVIGDARALPFASGSMNRVVARNLPSMLGADSKMASEIFRVLGPGGTVQLGSASRFGPAAQQAFEGAGFRSVEIRGLVLTATK